MITLRIKENNSQAKSLISYLLKLPFVEVLEKHEKPNKTTLEAFEETKKGKVTRLRKGQNLENLV